MEKLFFELIQVAEGRLSCLERGPSPEEWQLLYDTAQRQKVSGICFYGAERLFEYGLRGPQDLMLDWMAEKEVIKEKNEQSKRLQRVVQYYPEHLQLLRQSDDEVLPAIAVPKIEQIYELFLQGKLDVRLLMDYYFVLCKAGGKGECYRGSRLLDAVMGSLGVRRFAGGLMWLMQEVLGMKQEDMPWKPMEKAGRFLKDEMMHQNSKTERFVQMLLYFKIAL